MNSSSGNGSMVSLLRLARRLLALPEIDQARPRADAPTRAAGVVPRQRDVNREPVLVDVAALAADAMPLHTRSYVLSITSASSMPT